MGPKEVNFYLKQTASCSVNAFSLWLIVTLHSTNHILASKVNGTVLLLNVASTMQIFALPANEFSQVNIRFLLLDARKRGRC